MLLLLTLNLNSSYSRGATNPLQMWFNDTVSNCIAFICITEKWTKPECFYFCNCYIWLIHCQISSFFNIEMVATACKIIFRFQEIYFFFFFHPLCLLFSFLLLAASWCGTFRFDHHAWARERCRFHHTLHGLFCGSSAAQGWTHCGHVCLPGALRSVAVGMHCGHRAPRWHPSVPAQLAQPTAAAHGICVLHNTL